MGVAELVKRQATILGFAAVVLILLFLAIAAVPQKLLPFYLGGWLLTLGGISLKSTRFGEKSGPFVFIVNGIALFLFVAVAFVSFDFGIGTSIVAALIGAGGVVYSMSL